MSDYITLDEFRQLRPKTADVELEGHKFQIQALSSAAQIEWAMANEKNDPDREWVLVRNSLLKPAVPEGTPADVLPYSIRRGLFDAAGELNGWNPTITDEKALETLNSVAEGKTTAAEALALFHFVSRVGAGVDAGA